MDHTAKPKALPSAKHRSLSEPDSAPQGTWSLSPEKGNTLIDGERLPALGKGTETLSEDEAPREFGIRA